MEWKVGDRVRAVAVFNKCLHIYEGLQGTVIYTDGAAVCSVLVEFDKEMGGHNGRAMGKKGHCWWFSEVDEQYTYGVPVLEGGGAYLEKVRSNKKNNYW